MTDDEIKSPKVKTKENAGVKRKFSKIFAAVWMGLVCSILMCCCFGCSNNKMSEGSYLKTEQLNENTTELSPKSIYENACEYVVMIITYDEDKQPLSSGSGVVMSEDGYIITDAHVINNSMKTQLDVVFTNNTRLSANVVGFDNQTDLAVVKAETENLKAAAFGDSDEVSVGDWVLSLGNPAITGDSLNNTLTRGIVSSVNRTLNSVGTTMKYIQTDAAVNPGSSGGALLNMYGQVIGINASKVADNQTEGICFAAQVNQVKNIINDIIENGAVTKRAKIGVSATVLNENQAHSYNAVQGLIINSIYAESNLNSTEVMVNDIITGINHKNVMTLEGMDSELSKHNIGDEVTLTIHRMASNSNKSKNFDVTVKLIEDTNSKSSMSV